MPAWRQISDEIFAIDNEGLMRRSGPWFPDKNGTWPCPQNRKRHVAPGTLPITEHRNPLGFFKAQQTNLQVDV